MQIFKRHFSKIIILENGQHLFHWSDLNSNWKLQKKNSIIWPIICILEIVDLWKCLKYAWSLTKHVISICKFFKVWGSQIQSMAINGSWISLNLYVHVSFKTPRKVPYKMQPFMLTNLTLWWFHTFSGFFLLLYLIFQMLLFAVGAKKMGTKSFRRAWGLNPTVSKFL